MTGKTVTMVEAVKQVERLVPGAHIVAAAPSNAAADLLASRLKGEIGQMLNRFFCTWLNLGHLLQHVMASVK